MGCSNKRERRQRRRVGACTVLAIAAALTPFVGTQATPSASPAAAADTPGRPDPELRSLLAQAIRDHRGFKDRFHAEVWLTDMSNRLANKVPDPARRVRLLKIVHVEAVRAKLPPELVLAVIDVESDFKRFAISRSGALGLMQIMPFWLKEIGRPHANLFDPQTNLRLGCTILRYYLDKEHGDLRKALARYNGSAGKRIYPDRVFTLLSRRWFRE